MEKQETERLQLEREKQSRLDMIEKLKQRLIEAKEREETQKRKMKISDGQSGNSDILEANVQGDLKDGKLNFYQTENVNDSSASNYISPLKHLSPQRKKNLDSNTKSRYLTKSSA
jgi:hypothetical protein